MSTGMLGTSASKLDNIVLGSGAEATSDPLNQSVVDTLSLSQSIGQSLLGSEATSNLGLSQTVVVSRDVHVSVSDTLPVTDSLQKTLPEDIVDSLSLASAASVIADKHVAVEDPIALTQTVRPSIIAIDVSDTLGLTQTVTSRGPIYISINHGLNLTQPLASDPGALTPFVNDILTLQDVAGRVLTITVNDPLSLTDDGRRFTGALDLLNLTDVATAGKGPADDPIDSLSLVQTATYIAILSTAASSTLTLSQSAAYMVTSPCTNRSYSPFVGGSTSSDYTPPSATPPTLGSAVMTLTYPFTSPTMTVVLRNPDFGNRDRLSFDRINRETRGGTLVVFADPAWPKSQTLVVQASVLSAQQLSDLKDFLAASLGKEIGLLDYENRQWRGVILNPNTDLVDVGPEGRSVSIEFQGTLA